MFERNFWKIKNDLTVMNVIIEQEEFENFILLRLFFLFVDESNDLIVKCLSINRNSNFEIDIDAFEWISKINILRCCKMSFYDRVIKWYNIKNDKYTLKECRYIIAIE